MKVFLKKDYVGTSYVNNKTGVIRVVGEIDWNSLPPVIGPFKEFVARAIE